jgi:REP element-mobilizing transposase RayT
MTTYTYFITWTTYGTWLPGDRRGWRDKSQGAMLPKPMLERWAREQMKGETVLLRENDRRTVEQACANHCRHRGWHLWAVAARTNHVHVVVSADAKPDIVRDQLKANCTRSLREQDDPLSVARTWTRGGDTEIIDTDSEIEACVLYVTVAQDRKLT